MSRRRRTAAVVAAVAALIASAAVLWSLHERDRTRAWQQRLAAIVSPDVAETVACVPRGQRPLVLLALGQSNAGNHGAQDEPPAQGGPPRVRVFAGGGCRLAGDPLPGATGRHRSIWARLPEALRQRGVAGEVVLAVLAVDGTSMEDWARDDRPLQPRLRALARSLQQAGLRPDVVLWQHGEADARAGTSAGEYARGFEAVRQALRQSGVTAPIMLAQSTWCRTADGRAVREALQSLTARHRDVEAGPDTDRLTGEGLRLGCHFTRRGLEAAAAAWADRLAPALAVAAAR